MTDEKKIASAQHYINEVLADFHDAITTEPPNEISQLMYSVVETHLGAVRFLLLGEPGKAEGLLGNFEISRRMHKTDTK